MRSEVATRGPFLTFAAGSLLGPTVRVLVSIPTPVSSTAWAAAHGEAGGEAGGEASGEASGSEAGGIKGADEFWPTLFFAFASCLRILIAFLPMGKVTD